MAHDNQFLVVEVVYCGADGALTEERLQLTVGATVEQALLKSHLLKCHPELAQAPCGIWGRLCGPHEILRHQDRVEIYRPLKVDPKEARRLRHTRRMERPRAAH